VIFLSQMFNVKNIGNCHLCDFIFVIDDAMNNHHGAIQILQFFLCLLECNKNVDIKFSAHDAFLK